MRGDFAFFVVVPVHQRGLFVIRQRFQRVDGGLLIGAIRFCPLFRRRFGAVWLARMKIHARQFRRDLPCFRRDKIFDELVNGERFDEFAGMRVLHGRRDVFG